MDIARIISACNCWQDFKEAMQPLSKKEKGDCFEELTKQYLLLEPKYQTQLRHVWRLEEVPSKIRKHLNLPDLDEGIDLVAETMDGGYWAIQSKYREDETTSLTRRELSTFTDLAFSICKNIELGLICTTADRFSHKLKLHGERLSFCAGDVWSALDKEFFGSLHAVLKGREVKLRPKHPRDHQKSAIQNASDHFVRDGNDRGKLIMPCGTGKSLAAYWIAEKLNARSILIAVPSLSLIKQTLEVWARESVANGRPIHWMAVCSDETVAKSEKEDIAVLTQDLGVLVHTDPVEIADWLKKKDKGTTVVFSTYQSGKAIAEAAKMANVTFDLAILDEAHKTVGKKQGLFSYLLHDENIPIRKRIFMTATERRYRGQSDDIVSMDDISLYGETFELLSFKKALEYKEPILSDYKIVTVAVSRQEIADMVKRNVFVRPDKGEWNEDVEAESLAALVALRKVMNSYPIRHAISYHSSIARAKMFKANQELFSGTHPEYGKLATYHVSGKTPTAVRAREIMDFSNADRALITNARCMVEGVDIPNVDCVLFADPRNSIVDIVQAVGRALRPSTGKEYGYVVVPVLLEGGDGADASMPQSAYATILTVLRALAANDERIIEYFRSLSRGERREGRNRVFETNIPDSLPVNLSDFIQSVELQVWSRIARLAWRSFEESRIFVRSLKIADSGEWKLYCKGKLNGKGKKPADIPANPYVIYRDTGWVSWGDWLGTGFIAAQYRVFRPFKEARSFVRSLSLSGQKELQLYCQGKLAGKAAKPNDIPTDPATIYKNDGWQGMGDWLGTGTTAPRYRVYRPFEEARVFVHSLGLSGGEEWKLYCKGRLSGKGIKPEDIPTAPNNTYSNEGWESWGDWLGTGTIAPKNRVYRSFEEARAFVHSLGLSSSEEWLLYCKGKLPDRDRKPKDIPGYPGHCYKHDGWQGMGDWLGTGNIAPQNRVFQPFEEARMFARSLALSGQMEWRLYCKGKLPGKVKKPNDISPVPNQVYRDDGWQGWGDWLGTGNIAPGEHVFRPFAESRAFVQALALASIREWNLYCADTLPDKEKKPNDIPYNPALVYKDKGWKSWSDWLGTGTIAYKYRVYRSFEKARAFVQSLALSGKKEWQFYCKGELIGKGKKPDDIPSSPWSKYKDDGWQGMGDWLGTGFIANQNREFRPFVEARDFARSLALKNYNEWFLFCAGKLSDKGKKPDDIPAVPSKTYKSAGWIGIGDWLGFKRDKRGK